jgi:hypothetical protein
MVVAEVVEMAELDVVVVGGGAAGLSGALMLARARRSVVVVDAGAPRNAPAAGVHGLLGRDGTPPAELLDRGRAEVGSYGGEIVRGEVETVERDGDRFAVRLAGGGTLRARRLLVTTGLVDELPDVPGLRERWGRDVVHCPYCHGWEVRDRAIGVLATGPMSVHQALLFRQWSADVTLFTHRAPAPIRSRPSGWPPAASRGHRRGRRAGVAGDRLTGVRLADGTVDRPAGRGGGAADGGAGRLCSRRWACARPSIRPGPASTSRPTRPADRGGRRVGRGQRHRPERAGRCGRGGRRVRGRADQRRPGDRGDRRRGRRVPGPVLGAGRGRKLAAGAG